MQISKCLLIVGAAICVTAVSLGADNEAQVRAREALGKKLNELDPQSPAAPSPAVVIVPPKSNPPALAAVAAPTTPPAVVSSAPQQEVPQADAATIARAREALRQLQEPAPGQVTPPAPAPTPPPAPSATKAAPPPAPPVTPVPPPRAIPTPPPLAPLPAPAAVPNVQRVDAATIERAREALRQAAQQPLPGEVQPSPAAVTTPPAPVTTPPPAPVPGVLPQVPSVPTPAPAVAAPPAAAPPDFTTPAPAASPAAAEAALAAKMREAERNVRPPPASQANPATGKTTAPPAYEQAKKSKGLQFPPLEGPPLPISAAKQERLQVLLQKYMADQITPEIYHTERAKILAEP